MKNLFLESRRCAIYCHLTTFSGNRSPLKCPESQFDLALRPLNGKVESQLASWPVGLLACWPPGLAEKASANLARLHGGERPLLQSCPVSRADTLSVSVSDTESLCQNWKTNDWRRCNVQQYLCLYLIQRAIDCIGRLLVGENPWLNLLKYPINKLQLVFCPPPLPTKMGDRLFIMWWPSTFQLRNFLLQTEL